MACSRTKKKGIRCLLSSIIQLKGKIEMPQKKDPKKKPPTEPPKGPPPYKSPSVIRVNGDTGPTIVIPHIVGMDIQEWTKNKFQVVVHMVTGITFNIDCDSKSHGGGIKSNIMRFISEFYDKH